MQKHTRGFSLIELAVIMVIVGLFVATAIQTYDAYAKRMAINSTLEKRQNIEIALGKFVTENGRLPCPAIPNLPAGDENAGIENCPAVGSWPPSLTPEAQCKDTGFCRVRGARRSLSSADNGLGPTSPLERDRILRGVVPYKTLGLALWEAYDGWGMMMTYAVTELLSNSNIVSPAPAPAGKVEFQPKYGVINRIEWTQSGVYQDSPIKVGGISQTKAWPYAIVSHGPDKKGGWTPQGKLAIECPVQEAGDLDYQPGGTVPDEPKDATNCNPFSNSFRDTGNAVLVEGSPDYYDDAFLSVAYTDVSDKWAYANTTDIRSNQTRVGIGTQAPEQALDVIGAVRAEDVKVGSFCNESGEECFSSSLLTSVGIKCGPDGESYMRGIQYKNCDDDIPIDFAASSYGECPAGSFLVGFCTDGSKKCREPGEAGYTTPPCP